MALSDPLIFTVKFVDSAQYEMTGFLGSGMDLGEMTQVQSDILGTEADPMVAVKQRVIFTHRQFAASVKMSPDFQLSYTLTAFRGNDTTEKLGTTSRTVRKTPNPLW
ncbi:hypothetical protein HAT93_01445 [Dickeya solani]|nr:hypothetical protein [Dickeya solani]